MTANIRQNFGNYPVEPDWAGEGNTGLTTGKCVEESELRHGSKDGELVHLTREVMRVGWIITSLPLSRCLAIGWLLTLHVDSRFWKRSVWLVRQGLQPG